ncbi:F-box/LRR-repeat protein 8-like [Rhopilema esculentum]|uniref:F-box/LRR-repeat protein 8-like n=1 Tax=Rhopilema esculentum TaxID=499914 RepID=UPI0031D46B8E|eukprot:gene367-10031_t
MAADNFEEQFDWASLVPEVLVEVFSFLPLEDLFNVSKVCRAWRKVLGNGRIWQTLQLTLDEKFFENIIRTDENSAIVDFICSHCDKVSNLVISVDQTQTESTATGLQILQNLTALGSRRLRRIALAFTKENPLFYSAKTFVDVLYDLFIVPESGSDHWEKFAGVDLSKFPVCLDDKLINVLVENHYTHLSDIRLQNYSLVCNITKDCVHNLVKKCRNLEYFSIHMSAFDGETLKIFSTPRRRSIKVLSLFCQREDKYTSDIDSDDWASLCKTCPELRVKFYFDHTCPIFRVKEILKPIIPVSILKLRLLATVTDLIYLAANSYTETLEIFDVTTTSSRELDTAILFLATNCWKLRELHVWCRLAKSVVDQILSLCEFEKYTLAFNVECEQ